MSGDPLLVSGVVFLVMWVIFLIRAPRLPEFGQLREFSKLLHGVAIGGWLYIALTRASDGESGLAWFGGCAAAISTYIAFWWERRYSSN